MVPVLVWSLWPVNFRVSRLVGGGSSGTPLPKRTQITATSTVSTKLSSTKLRKSDTPPQSHMSLPGFERSRDLDRHRWHDNTDCGAKFAQLVIWRGHSV